MHVLVTGGAGYLGSTLVPLLIKKGHRVRVFDRFCFGSTSLELSANSKQLEIIPGDVRRLQEAPNLFEGIDAIVHLASLSNDPSCSLNSEMAIDVNVDSTRELASQAIQHGVHRFVLGSSCAVYGQAVFDVLDEESPTNPVSDFGRTKLEAERALLAMHGPNFVPVVARTATMFGWSPRMRFDLAVNQMVATALRQSRINVLGGGNQWRPFIHVSDAANAILLLLDAPMEKVQGRIFNVGCDELNFQIRDLADRISKPFPGVRIDVPKSDEDLRSFRVQFQRIREELGFRCAKTLEDGIGEVRSKLVASNIDPFDETYFNAKRMRTLLATPVDEGGEPMASHYIPLYKPSLSIAEEEAVLEALRSGWLTDGPRIAQFERAFAETVGAQNVVAACSCTAALHLCLVHLGVGPGDEVITSPITWASTGNTVINMGAKVVFADILPDTLNIDPAAVERAITPRTKAIMPVHLAGQPCDLDAIHAIAKKHGIPVIEDAAHALGASYKGAPIGSCSDFTCFSFYAIKNITTMEGGTVTTKDKSAADHIRLLSANGMSATAFDRYGRSAVASPAEVFEPGFKYKMNNVGAAMGVTQLKRFAAFKAARKRLARLYQTVLSDVDEIQLPAIRPDVEHAWHLFIVRLRLERLNKTRDEIAHALRRENVGTSIHFYGLHLHKYYRETMGLRPEDFPNATNASRDMLSIPLFPMMTDRNVNDVVEALKKVLLHAKKG
jgi:dTDP-4-amino-4,6-dideoxygalactose transaminase/nucleoside-diphosphate-sugar epimerase